MEVQEVIYGSREVKYGLLSTKYGPYSALGYTHPPLYRTVLSWPGLRVSTGGL